ncbi:MAG TPA: asparagine synthase-related protein [Pyrinomonadaceae bacterium]|nr:asparagine synthase-related protein [Pyrinomonadaceae bacterium]
MITREIRGLRVTAAARHDAIAEAYETWGEDCVDHLNGDFAFGIWDSRRRKLFCARDHFGVKPFFYAQVSGDFIFSDSLNELREHPEVSDELNETAIGDYLLFGVNQDLSSTTFRDIHRLPPAHCLTFANGSIAVRRYWTPSVSEEVRFRDARSYVERFLELLTEAVRDRVGTDRVSVLMSGGLDSTSVAAIACDLIGADQVRACTVAYEKLIADEEGHYSKVARDHLGIQGTRINADGYGLFEGDLQQPEPFLISLLGGQFKDSLRACADGGRVALTGWDGDALMNDPVPRLRSRIKRILRPKQIDSSLPEWIAESFAQRTNLHERWQASFRHEPIRTKSARIRVLNSKMWPAIFEGYDASVTKLDLQVRHPFMDLRLVKFLLAIPRTPWCVNKHILREAMKNRLPAEVINRPKTALAGDPALQLVRRASVRWLDSFEVSPQLERFVNLDRRRLLADEQTSDGLWASLRVYALNHWLTNSQPIARRTPDNLINNDRAYETSIA